MSSWREFQRARLHFIVALTVTVGAWADTITGPSALQVNLGFIPFESYHDQATNGTTIPNCNSGNTVPQCFQEIFSAYAAQGVTGVRFFFTLHGGWLSNPLDPGKRAAWNQNVLKFFQDLKMAGINGITISPSLLGTPNDGEFVVENMLDVCDEVPGPTIDLGFWPTAPIPTRVQIVGGIKKPNSVPYGAGIDDCYGDAPANPQFVGWDSILDIFDSMLSAANAAGVKVFEFDIQNEVNLASFTLYARLIVDNKDNNRDVLTEVRNKMSAYGFDPLRVTFSPTDDRASLLGWDCTTPYGDSGRVLNLSALWNAMLGGSANVFGRPESPKVNNILCGGQFSTFATLGVTHVPPRIVDLHSAPCLVVENGPCILDQNFQAEVFEEAKTTFSAVKTFLDTRGLSDSIFVLGETHPNNECAFITQLPQAQDAPPQTVAGFNASTLAGFPTVFRPFESHRESCYPHPADNLNPNNSGPYTPSPPGPPTADSVTPSSGSGPANSSQTFSYQFSDPDGYEDLRHLQIVAHGALGAANSCYLFYVPHDGDLFLMNDAATQWFGPLTPGNAGTLENSQCKVNVGSSSVNSAGNSMTLNLALEFKFEGVKKHWMWASDRWDLDTGWQQRGSWTAGTNDAPTADWVSPSSGSGAVGSPQMFTYQFSDPDSYLDLKDVEVIANGVLSWQNSCLSIYVLNGGLLYLRNDANTGWIGPQALGTPGTLENTQCRINVGSSSAMGAGNSLTLNLNLTFKTEGVRTQWMQAIDFANVQTGWQQRGSWSAGTNDPPSADSVTPSSGSGTGASFSYVFSDPDGYLDLKDVEVIANEVLSWQNSCLSIYVLNGGLLYLRNDANSGWIGPQALGTPGTLENAKCIINVGSSSATGAGNSLTLNLNLTFKTSGLKTQWMQALDKADIKSGWQQRGSWTVP